MILVEVRSDKLHVAGEPHPAPSWESAMLAFGKLCVEHNVPDEDGYEIVLVGNWDPEKGTSKINPNKFRWATSEECRAKYSPAPIDPELLKEAEL